MVADQVLALITHGHYAAGSRIPSENSLMKQYAVSRTTVRTALARLREEGYVEPRRGSGVFVRRAERVGVPADDPHAAAVILASRLTDEALTTLTTALARFAKSPRPGQP
ncbi:winged helix-turn-helix domain-containing protein [Streptomyces sp. NPDC059009]|uniref:winged helix-turn-helix domain-containing protein n=1 Tax=Streptomyces sp. NPDC059009 TaxID=3346694 RepID=UPI00369B543A